MIGSDGARWLLIVHLFVAMATVAVSTHTAMWTIRYLRPRSGRKPVSLAALRRFAKLNVILFALAMLIGGVIYPTFKARVRIEFLENPEAISQSVERAEHFRASFARYYGDDPSPRLDTAARIEASKRATRWFDVKEHWAALGLMLSFAFAWIVGAGDPRKAAKPIAGWLIVFATAAAATTWISAVVGALVSAYRSVG